MAAAMGAARGLGVPVALRQGGDGSGDSWGGTGGSAPRLLPTWTSGMGGSQGKGLLQGGGTIRMVEVGKDP